MKISANSAVFIDSKLRSCGQTRLAATYVDCRRRAANFAAACDYLRYSFRCRTWRERKRLRRRIMTAVASSAAKQQHHRLFAGGSPLISRHPPPPPPHQQQPATRNHYVNICTDLLPPPPPPSSLHLGLNTPSSREPSVSDSEMSTSSISGLSESSEIRALFSSLPPSSHHHHHLVHDSNYGSVANNPHYNQLKVVEGSRVGERTRRILHRPSHIESDSSSSLAESSESLSGGGGSSRESSSNKQKEKEHYNKLKLNLDSLSGNKRAISGAFFCFMREREREVEKEIEREEYIIYYSSTTAQKVVCHCTRIK